MTVCFKLVSYISDSLFKYLSLNIKTQHNQKMFFYEEQFLLIKELNLEGDGPVCSNRK